MSKPKLIISTTGTSIGTNVRRDILNQPFTEKEIREEIKSAISKVNDINSRSAEIKSLNKIGIDRSDHIVFIHSDTPEGKFCTEILKECCIGQWKCAVSIEGIKGLQVKDARIFAAEGIKNYLKHCIVLIERYSYSHNVIFNSTGGFKGLVPYTTLLGMFFAKPIYYIFENSDSLIRLPSIPINYDEELMDRCAERLNSIERETALSADKFWEGIDFYERDRYLPLIDEECGEIILSSIGMLLWERYKKDFPPNLKRSDKSPEKKEINLRDDHGKDILMHWAKRLVKNPYVDTIINSLPFNPQTTDSIKNIKDDGLIELVLTKTDAGYGMVIKTTGRNYNETKQISEILKNRYQL